MSHLIGPRLAFSGRFLSDVSTRNNEQKNYNDPPGGKDNWNAMGGGTFEPLGCQITGAWLNDLNQTGDPALGYMVTGADNRPSGKMVDLDPNWQSASEIWGLKIRIIAPDTGELAVEGEFFPASFRDLHTRQLRNVEAENLQPMGGRFVSTITKVVWGPAADRSQVMRALRDQSLAGELAICLHQFGYYYSTDKPNYRTGALIGTIGVRTSDELLTAHVGRRTLPLIKGPTPLDSYIDAVDVAVGTASIGADFGHSLIIDDPDGTITDLGDYLGWGRTQSLALGLAPPQGATAPLNDSQVLLFGEAEIMAPHWYIQTGGIVEWPASPDLLAKAAQALITLYLRTEQGLYPLASETHQGLFVRADSFVRRLDPGDRTTVIFKACRYGLPAAGVRIVFEPPTSLSDGRTYPSALNYPSELVTGPDGRAELEIISGTPVSRGSIDGMVFGIVYTLRFDRDAQNPANLGLQPLDLIVVHLRENFAVPSLPTWEHDVLPILRQYAHLYPIMSQHLFNLADEETVKTHARHMLMAMERPISDPNYMPVTRDLSEAKRQTIIGWLKGAIPEADSQLEQRRLFSQRRESQAEAIQPSAPDEEPPFASDAKRRVPQFARVIKKEGEF